MREDVHLFSGGLLTAWLCCLKVFLRNSIRTALFKRVALELLAGL